MYDDDDDDDDDDIDDYIDIVVVHQSTVAPCMKSCQKKSKNLRDAAMCFLYCFTTNQTQLCGSTVQSALEECN